MEVNKHLVPWMEGPQPDVCMLEKDPELRSEDMIAKIFRRNTVTTLNLREAQSFIKDYLKVLCEST